MRSTFLWVPAFLGRIDGPTRCAFWADDPVDHGFDPLRLIDIDLAGTPSAAAAGDIGWDRVQVDDCFTAPSGVVSGTTIGPGWPEFGLVGAVLLERAFVDSLPLSLRPTVPAAGMGGHAYEYTTVLYWPHLDDPRAGRRYAGHHAEILEEHGCVARVAVYPPGTSDQPDRQAVSMWIDFTSPEHHDAGPHSLTTVGIGDRAKSGALFLINS